MTALDGQEELEAQFAQWRHYLQRRPELQRSDADELEDHLRGCVYELVAVGLRADEAFLVAVKRMGSLDDLSREFAREHSERLWKQLVLTGESNSSVADSRSRGDLRAIVVLGGGVLTAFTAGTFQAIGIDPEKVITQWLLPCGAAAATVVAAWLVEAKQSVVENIAPVLTRLFTPLFTAVLLAFLVALVWTSA